MGELAGTNVTIDRDSDGMPERLRYAVAHAGPLPTLMPCPFCGSTDLAWDTGAVECQDCTARGPQHETRRVGVLQWNDRANARAAAANVTVYVAGIGNVRVPPDDALRMLFDDVLSDAYENYAWQYLHSIYSDKQRALNQADWDRYANGIRQRLAALLGDGVK